MVLANSLASWPGEGFAVSLKSELAGLGNGQLPLHAGLRYASHVSDEPAAYTLLSVNQDAADIIVKLGVFYKGLVAGCSCADDPTPNTETNEYCVVELRINKLTAETELKLLDDEY